MRLIDRDAIKYRDAYILAEDSTLPIADKYDIEMMPTVDAVPVMHGHWIIACKQNAIYNECSNCKAHTSGEQTPYCPQCGARMDGNGTDRQKTAHKQNT